MLMMLCLTLLVVFKSNIFATEDNPYTSYVGGKGHTLVFQKEWNDGGDVSSRPESINFKVDLAYTETSGNYIKKDVPITLTAKNNWSYTYQDQYGFGAYGYYEGTLKELKVDGYKYDGENVEWKGYDSSGHGGTVIVTLKNKKEVNTGNLTVSKTVAGNAGEKNKDFHFTVTPSDKTISGIFGDMEFIDGAATIILKDGESKTATGLPSGITYEVTETEENQDGYVTTKTDDTETITKEGTAEAKFTNTKDVTPPEPEQPDKPQNLNTTDTPNQYSSNPSTSDQTNFEFYLSLLAMSGLLIKVLGVWRKKRANENR